MKKIIQTTIVVLMTSVVFGFTTNKATPSIKKEVKNNFQKKKAYSLQAYCNLYSASWYAFLITNGMSQAGAMEVANLKYNECMGIIPD